MLRQVVVVVVVVVVLVVDRIDIYLEEEVEWIAELLKFGVFLGRKYSLQAQSIIPVVASAILTNVP